MDRELIVRQTTTGWELTVAGQRTGLIAGTDRDKIVRVANAIAARKGATLVIEDEAFDAEACEIDTRQAA